MADKLWKATERYYAKAFRGKRNPVSLQQKYDERTLADVTSREMKIAAEIKQSKQPKVKTIRDALKQASDGKPAADYSPIAIFHTTGDRHDDDVVCMLYKHAKILMPGIVDE